MIGILSLPDEIIIEIMLKLPELSDFRALLCVCKRISGLGPRLNDLQKSMNLKLQYQFLLTDGTNGNLYVVKGLEALSARFTIGLDDLELYNHKIKIDNYNSNKIEELCKLRGDMIIFRKKTKKDGDWVRIDPKYIRVMINWQTRKVRPMYICTTNGVYDIGHDEILVRPNISFAEFYALYDEYYKGTKFEEFPGNILLQALKMIDGAPE